MRIAIIGTGPAGLFAAWAAREHLVRVFDTDISYQPQRIFALQYLHERCELPDEAIRDLQLRYRVDGFDLKPDDEGVVRKMYNVKLGRPHDDVNSTRFAFSHPKTVHSLKTAYGWLHARFTEMGALRQQRFSWLELYELARYYDVVISTAPLNKLLPDWTWPMQELLITQDYTPIEVEENECVFNVHRGIAWSRTTRLDGGSATEWVRRTNLPPTAVMAPLRKVTTPPRIPSGPANLILAGRWGTWSASPLTHDTYKMIRGKLR